MNKKLEKMLKIYGVLLSLGYIATPMVGEAATTFPQTLTGDQAVDEENGYLIDSSVAGTLKYQFASGDNIKIQADHSGDPINNHTDIRAAAIQIEDSITDHIDLTDLKNISIEATGISGIATDESSTSVYMTLAGVFHQGTGVLTLDDDTTIKIGVVGSNLVNENIDENLNYSSSFVVDAIGISPLDGDTRLGNNATIQITNQANQVEGFTNSYSYNYLRGVDSYTSANLTFGDQTTIKITSENSTLGVSQSFSENTYMRGVEWGDGTLTFGNDTKIQLDIVGGEVTAENTQEGSWSNASFGSDVVGVSQMGGEIHFGDNTTVLLNTQDSKISGFTGASPYHRLMGFYGYTNGSSTFGDNTTITVINQNQEQQTIGNLMLNKNLYGVQMGAGGLVFGDHTKINTLLLNTQPSYSGESLYDYTTNIGASLNSTEDISFGDGTIIRSHTEIGNIQLEPTQNGFAYSNHLLKGVEVQGTNGITSLGDNTQIEVSVVTEGASGMSNGLSNLTLSGVSTYFSGEMTIGDHLSVNVTSSEGAYVIKAVDDDSHQWFETRADLSGIFLYGSEKMTIGNEAQINVAAQMADIEFSSIFSNGNSLLTLSGISAQLYDSTESSQFGDNTSITVDAKGGNIKNSNQISDSIEANGIKISSNIVDIPALRFGTGTKIFVNAEGGTLENVETLDEYSSVNAYGIRSEGSLESALFFEGDLSVTAIAKPIIWNGVAQSANAYSLFANVNGAIKINDNGINKVELIGDLGTGTYGADNKVTLDLSSEKSFLQGTAKAQEGNIFLTLANGATWRPQGDEDVEAQFGISENSLRSVGGMFTLNEGGIVDLAWWNNQNGVLNPANRFRTLSINNAALNNGGVFRVNSDVLGYKADRINIANGVGSGTQYIQVAYDPSMKGTSGVIQAVNGNEPIVLDIQGGTGPDNVTGKIYQSDSPLYQYEIDPTILWDGTQGKISSLRYARTENLSETPYTVVDAQAAFRNLWKLEGNNMFRRMGDLRLAPEKSDQGLWARLYTGKLDSDSSYGRTFDQSYTGWQVGFDKSHKVSSGKLHTGVMINYLDSNPSYHSGSGKLYSTGVGVYGSWIGNNNHYVDLAIRGSNLHNDYSLLDNSGTQVSGKYDTWAYGVSAEYGYRAKLKNNWTIEPQVELSLGHIGSGDHTTSSGLEVNQSSINTSVGRIGILFGKDFGSENKKGNAYFKASWIHDFSGDGILTGAFQGDQANLKTAQHRGSGLELNVGTNLKINNKMDSYFELSKTFGAPVDTNWQINGGIRINW